MTDPRRRPAVALAAGLVCGGFTLALLQPASAQDPPPGPEWEGEWGVGLENGEVFDGDVVRLFGSFAYEDCDECPSPSPQAAITDVRLRMTRTVTATGCAQYTTSTHVGDGDGGPPTSGTIPTTSAPDPTASTAPTTSTPPPTEPTTTTIPGHASTYVFTYDIVPACNGFYDVEVIATVDPGGPQGPYDSEPLVLEGIRVSLVPPPVRDLTATVNADRTVSVNWNPPEGYDAEDGGASPPDFLRYRVERAGPDGEFAFLDTVGRERNVYVDRSTAGASPATFRYRVLAVRQGATSGSVVMSSSAPVVTVSVAGPPGTAPPITGSGGRGRPGGVTPAQPAVDAGFDPSLDYPELGEEDPVLPEDASGLLDINGDQPGSGLLVPFAIALLLVVWAMHLRYLSRRAAEPI